MGGSLSYLLCPPAFLHEFKGHAIIARKGGEPGNEAILLPKLCNFYDMCVGPEIVSPKHPYGLPLRDLRNE